MNQPSLLFVSKPVVPPWNDGSKNLVRDIASHLIHVSPKLMTIRGEGRHGHRHLSGLSGLSEKLEFEPIYRTVDGFRQPYAENMRVLRRLVFGSHSDIWHFVFAPNLLSSTAAKFAITSRRFGERSRLIKKLPLVVQTVASVPRSFFQSEKLLFGDEVVVLSRWTKHQIERAGCQRKITVIAPCAEVPKKISERDVLSLREKLGLPRQGEGVTLIYPGDYEVSNGAMVVAKASANILSRLPSGSRIVYACRKKTGMAIQAQMKVEACLKEQGTFMQTTHLGEVKDMGALLQAVDMVLFPVDDTFGKVDVPLVLIEALALGKPLILASGGPLEEIKSASFVLPNDPAGLANSVVELAQNRNMALDQINKGLELYSSTFSPKVVAGQYDALYIDMLGRMTGAQSGDVKRSMFLGRE